MTQALHFGKILGKGGKMNNKNLTPKGEEQKKYSLTKQGRIRIQQSSSKQTKGNRQPWKSVFGFLERYKKPIGLRELIKEIRIDSKEIERVLAKGILDRYIEVTKETPGLAS